MRKDEEVAAGRGFLLIAGAKAWFLVTSAGIALGLPRLFGEPESFGRFKVVSSAATIINMVLITATVQAVSKLTSERHDASQHIRSIALRIQLVLGGAVSLGMALFADSISEHVFGDSTLAPYLRIAAMITACFKVIALLPTDVPIALATSLAPMPKAIKKPTIPAIKKSR